MNDAGVDGFFDQIDQWSTEIWRKHPLMKGLECGIERNVFNSEKFYRHWLEFILPLIEIPIGPWSRHAELKSLFHLINNLNPNYFRSNEIEKLSTRQPT